MKAAALLALIPDADIARVGASVPLNFNSATRCPLCIAADASYCFNETAAVARWGGSWSAWAWMYWKAPLLHEVSRCCHKPQC